MLDIKEVYPEFQKLQKTDNCIVIVLKTENKIAITSPVSIILKNVLNVWNISFYMYALFTIIFYMYYDFGSSIFMHYYHKRIHTTVMFKMNALFLSILLL